jgi:hypothetical protein
MNPIPRTKVKETNLILIRIRSHHLMVMITMLMMKRTNV